MTTAISRDDVLHLAQLSNLQLAEEEIKSMQSQVSEILDYVKQLGELDTTGVEPTYQVTDLKNVSRADTVTTSTATRDTLIGLASQKMNDQMKVPKVL